MKKRIIKGIFATFAAAAVCVPLAACGSTADTGTTTAVTTESITASSEESTTGVTEAATTSESGKNETTAAESSETTTSSGSSETTTAAEISGHTPLENAVVKNDDLQIEIKGYQVYPAGVGGASNSLKPVVVFYYDVTNNGDKEIDALSAWTEIFDAYQNTGDEDRNILGQGIFVDESIPSEDGKTPLKKGETKSYYKSYELTDDTTSVTLKSHDGLGGAKLGDDIIVRVMS